MILELTFSLLLIVSSLANVSGQDTTSGTASRSAGTTVTLQPTTTTRPPLSSYPSTAIKNNREMILELTFSLLTIVSSLANVSGQDITSGTASISTTVTLQPTTTTRTSINSSQSTAIKTTASTQSTSSPKAITTSIATTPSPKAITTSIATTPSPKATTTSTRTSPSVTSLSSTGKTSTTVKTSTTITRPSTVKTSQTGTTASSTTGTTAPLRSPSRHPSATTSSPPPMTTSTMKFSTSGQNQNYSSITRRPTNTAAVAGSTNITLACSSSYGTDNISWSFSPLAFASNEKIEISGGYKFLDKNLQQYELQATINSSVLLIRQLSTLTEGNYYCFDGVETVATQLLIIPHPILMEPLFGPVAGGTNITISGSTAFEYLSTNVGSYRGLPNITDVINVYVGDDLSAASMSLLTNKSSAFEFVVVTPSTTEESIGRPLPIIIEFSPTPFNMSFNTAFIYLPNPEITGISPNSFIVTGGTLLDVFGRYLSSVAKPIIQLKVVITRAAYNNSTSTLSTTLTSRVCTVPPGNDTFMQCPMPPLNIPDDFLEILNKLYNATVSRKRRDMQPIDQLFTISHNLLLSRKKRDVNVQGQTVHRANGTDQLDIYLGFILDGYNAYENINDRLPDTKLLFFSPPEINSTNKLIEFDPSEEELIYVKGLYMLRGCRLRDYVVHTGNQICTNNDLQDNQLSCRPPKVEPSSTVDDSLQCGQYLSITITIGYKQYQYACLRYIDHSMTFALIVGLIVGFSAFALFITILITCIVRRKFNKKTGIQQQQDPREQEMINRRPGNSTQPGAQPIIYGRDTPSIYQPTDYSTSISDVDNRSQYMVPSSDASDDIVNLSSNAFYQYDKQI